MMTNGLTAVPGIKVGHAQNLDKLTGCTAILCEKGAAAGVIQSGGAPGTRETDLLRPGRMVDKVHAIMLAGGSAYGLAAADGAMRWLEEQGAGVNTGAARVPIVPSAILFDLAVGDASSRPDSKMGYEACQNASEETPSEGNIGAGTGASVGKILGGGQAMKAGIGTASMELGGGVVVSALIAVNAFGDVINPQTGKILAGVRSLDKGILKIGEDYFADTLEVMKGFIGKSILKFAARQNTVIGVIATNAKFDKEEINNVAKMGHNGLIRTIRPANTQFDGDTIFALSYGNKSADQNLIGAAAAEVVAEAVMRGVRTANSAGGLPGLADLEKTI